MGENESGSPWDELAQELGVEPSAESSERSQPPPIDIPAAHASDAADVAQPPEHSPSDWNALASSLGIEITEPEPAEELATESVEPPADDLHPDGETGGFEESEPDEGPDEPLPPLPSEVDQIMSGSDWGGDEIEVTGEADEVEEEEGPTISGETARNAFDALFTADGSAVALPPFEPSAEEPVEDSLGSEGSIEQEKEELGSSSDSEEEPPKRKRPRRRRRGRGGRKTEKEQSTDEQVSGGSDEPDEGQREELEEKDAAENDDEKPRRRRSRRRPRRSTTAEDPARNGDVQDAADEGEDDDDELSEQQTDSSRARGHRNLPTWAEAVGVIVDANIELHEKMPNKSSSPRGRGRGGRRRKKS